MVSLSYILKNVCLFNFAVFLVFAPYNRLFGKIFLVIGSCSWILLNVFKYRKNFYKWLFPRNFLNWPILIFLGICVLTVIFSINPYHSQKTFFSRIVLYFVFFWIGCGLVKDSRRNILILSGAFIFSSFYMGAGGVLDYFSIYSHSGRLWTVFGKKLPFNLLPLFLTYFTPFVFALCLFARNLKLRVLCGISFTILIFFLIWQQGRSALVAAAVGLLFISLFKGRKTFLLALLTLIFTTFILSTFFSGIREKIKTIPYPEKWNFRMPLYRSAISMFRDHPVTGVGLGMYEKMIKTSEYKLPDDYPRIEINRDKYLHAHNVYCEIAAEMGIIGICGFLWIFAVFFMKVSRKAPLIADDLKKAILIGLAGTVAATLVFGIGLSIITVGTNETMMFWFLFGMAAGLVPPDIKEKNGDFGKLSR